MRSLGLYLLLFLLAAGCFSAATVLQPRAAAWSRRPQGNVLKVLLGDGRRLFANHFFVKADVYLHSGYYPSIFDRKPANKESAHLAGHEEGENEKEHEAEDFLGRPKDVLEKFGRHFMITQHTHLEGGREREILPWLKLSAELDPQRVETYTVAAYWLRSHLGKIPEAEQFLREGLRANPDSVEILFSLGQLYYASYHDAARARNVLELALRRWDELEAGGKRPEKLSLEQITVNLARLEEEQGNLARAIEHLERAKTVSPSPQNIQTQITELKQKLTAAPQVSGQAINPSKNYASDR